MLLMTVLVNNPSVRGLLREGSPSLHPAAGEGEGPETPYSHSPATLPLCRSTTNAAPAGLEDSQFPLSVLSYLFCAIWGFGKSRVLRLCSVSC